MLNKENFEWARDALFEEFRRVYRGDSKSPMIITPILLREMGYSLGVTDRPIIFLGFTSRKPLLVPKGAVFKDDVWFADCHFQSALGVTFDKDLYFVNSTIDTAQKENSTGALTACRTGHVKGLRIFDQFSWASYREDRKVSRGTENGVSKVVMNTEDDKRPLEHAFMEVFNSVPKFDIITYARQIPQVQVMYNKNDSSYTIVGKIVIHGPYQFNAPEKLTFKGDLLYLDIVNAGFTDAHCSNITLDDTCAPDVQSYYEYERTDY